MSAILISIVSFFVQALALKVSLGMFGQPSNTNRYSTALGVAAVLNLSAMVLGFVPLFGWFLYAALWLGVVMSVYKIGFGRSLGVAVLQIIVRWVLTLLLGFFGIKAGGAFLAW